MSARTTKPLATMLALTIALFPTSPAVGSAAPNPDDASRIRNDQWHLRFLDTTKAHRLSQGEGVVVAVPDTGVDPHPDLRLNLLRGMDLIGDSTDGQSDPHSHGTGMAGLIAAHGQGDSIGALGIAPKAKILPIRTMRSDAEGINDDLATAILYAIRSGVDVISISSAGGFSPSLSRAISAAQSADIIVVAAAGNRPDDAGVMYPATASGVVAVAGIDEHGNHADISVEGAEIDVAAPAVDIYSTSYRSLYLKGTGTSSATAIVAGAVALIRAKYPYLPADEVVHRLTATAVDKGPPGRDDQYGHGVIDLVAALTADVPPRGFTSPPTGAATDAAPSTAAGPSTGEGDGATVRGLATLGVILAAGGGWALYARHRRRSDDPPPRISR